MREPSTNGASSCVVHEMRPLLPHTLCQFPSSRKRGSPAAVAVHCSRLHNRHYREMTKRAERLYRPAYSHFRASCATVLCVLVIECTCESLVSVTGQCVAQPPYCRIVLQSFSIPTATLTTSSAGLTVAASGISLQITADWHYKDKDM